MDAKTSSLILDYIQLGVSRVDIYDALCEDEAYSDLSYSVFELWYEAALKQITRDVAIDREYVFKRSIEIYEKTFEELLKKSTKLYKVISAMVGKDGNLNSGARKGDFNKARRESSACIESMLKTLQNKEDLLGAHSKEARGFWKDSLQKEREFSDIYDTDKLNEGERNRLIEIFKNLDDMPLSSLEQLEVAEDDYDKPKRDVPDDVGHAVLGRDWIDTEAMHEKG